MNIKKLTSHQEKYWKYNKNIFDNRLKGLVKKKAKKGYTKKDGEIWATLSIIGFGLIATFLALALG